jgi:galactokinase
VGGLVLPAAIDRSLAIALGPAENWEVDPAAQPYVTAVAQTLARGPVRAAIVSDVPIGAGVSSSAALLVACCAALAPELAGPEAARLCQRAEHAATGVRVGLMDQFASALGRAGCALLLDCGSLEHQLVPLPDDLVIAVIDSGVSRRLADTPYNRRRDEVEAAVAGSGGPAAARRLRHVLGETARVGEFVAALQNRDIAALGRLLAASHRSLRDDFEVSTPELDSVVAAATALAGCVGARLMGAGFGGSVLALLESGAQPRFETEFGERVFFCRTASGPYAAGASFERR